MIDSTGYRLSCDEPQCMAEEFDDNPFRLRREAETVGWTFGVKLNGEQARRGGKDYCPAHRKGASS